MARRRSSRSSRSLLRALLPPAVHRRRVVGLPRVARLPAVAVPRLRALVRKPASGHWYRGQRSALAGGRSYDVYLPAGLRRRTRVPLLLLLHGCRQTTAEFADATRFTTVADRNGFILVLPQQEDRHHPMRCWRWYESRHQQRGAGEPAVLAAVVQQVLAEQTRWRVDPRRVYAAGLSAGGAMALTIAATYPDVFAAVGVHSAPAYRSATQAVHARAAMAARTAVPPPVSGVATAMAPVIVVQGTADQVVLPDNGDRVADQWLAFRAAAAEPGRVGRTRADADRTADGRRYTRVRWYCTRGRTVLEYWLVAGLGHAWSGGRPGGSYSDPTGPRAATVMWQFLRRHRLGRHIAAPRRAVGA